MHDDPTRNGVQALRFFRFVYAFAIFGLDLKDKTGENQYLFHSKYAKIAPIQQTSGAFGVI